MKSDGSFRARVIAKGYSQKPGTDFNPDRTYTPVAHTTSFRFLLAMTAILGWVFWITDIQLAYLCALLKERLYMQQLEGLVQGSGLVCKLKKSLYRLVQSAHTWHKVYLEKLRELGCKSTICDSAFFTRKSLIGETLVNTHTDDGVGVSSSVEERDSFLSLLKAHFT